MQSFAPLVALSLVAISAFLLSWALTGLVLRRLSGAKHQSLPNERTMHARPTANVGGIAIVATVLGLGSLLIPPTIATTTLAGCIGALAFVSLADQYRPIWPLSRLLVQATVVAAALSFMPVEVRLVPALPFALERVAIGLAWLWMINLTNFIDGIDGIAATGGAMIAIGSVAVVLWPSVTGAMSFPPALQNQSIVALLLAGACLGYLVWNWHPARIFMGDVGSIPLGFLLGWLMLDLAQRGYGLPALILPAVFVADATLTLLKRLLRGEKVWRPHRSHFYQRAVQGGTSPASVVRRMVVAQLLLIGLAVLAVAEPIPAAFGASAVVILLLAHWSALAQGKPSRE